MKTKKNTTISNAIYLAYYADLSNITE